MPAKRNTQQEGQPQAKRPRQAPIYLGKLQRSYLEVITVNFNQGTQHLISQREATRRLS